MHWTACMTPEYPHAGKRLEAIACLSCVKCIGHTMCTPKTQTLLGRVFFLNNELRAKVASVAMNVPIYLCAIISLFKTFAHLRNRNEDLSDVI